MKPYVIISCFFLFISASSFKATNDFFETKAKKDSIVATYHFVNGAQAQTIVMHLYKDKTYSLAVHGDHYDYYSKGTWQKKGRTYVVNSNVQKKEIPITITQSYTKSSSPYIQIEDIKNSTGFLFKDIEILTNYDSTKACLANVGSNCKIKKEDLKSIQIRLVGNTTSAWHPVVLADNSNTIKISVDINFIPEFYFFYKDKKFMKKGKKLYDPDMNVYYEKGDMEKEKK